MEIDVANSIIIDQKKLDTLSLVKLPRKVSNPIKLLSTDEDLFNKKAILAGVKHIGRGGIDAKPTTSLSFGTFEIITTEACGNNLWVPDKQICTLGWDGNNNVPCWHNGGEGLVIGDKLVGVFLSPHSCLSEVPAIYTRVYEHSEAIKNITGIQ